MLLHTCSLHGQRRAPEGAEPRVGAGGRNGALTVDLHCHIVIPAVEKLVAGRREKLAEPEMMLRTMGAASVEHNNKVMLPAAGPKLTNLELRLTDMDAMGVDVQVLSPSPTQFYYWAGEELAREIVRTTNEGVAQACAKQPDRLLGLGSVALQHARLAAEQLEHCVKTLGLRGVEISSSAGGRDYDDAHFDPFWAKADELGCVVFLHPFGTTLGERLNRYYLSNTIGQPLETTIALSHLIFGGVLDRYPGLKICAAHGGGYLPYYIGRSNHAFRVRPEAKRCEHAPAEYLKRIWFDTVVYQPEALRDLIAEVGVDQVVVGTDYPFDMGCYDVHALIAGIPGLKDAERAQLLGGNAARLVGGIQWRG